jgi:sulfhydrogenase subunit alpha
MSRLLRVEHLGRVEGHGGITVELEGDELVQVRFDVFEGLRLLAGLVRGRSWEDVPPIVSRICAICSAVHAVTAVEAIEAAFEVRPSEQTGRLRDLLLLGENVASHALHLFLLAGPDYLGYASAPAMAAEHAEAVKLGLRLKQLGNRIQEVVGGRAIHPVNVVPGGFARTPATTELVALEEALAEGCRDAEAALGFFAGLPRADFGGGATAFAALEPAAGYGYRGGRDVVFLDDRERRRVPAVELAEAIDGRFVPHSHARHATFEGRPFMVGALARLSVFGSRLDPAGRAAAAALGLSVASPNPLDNNLAQAVELVRDVEAGRALLRELLDRGVEPERPVAVRPRAGTGTAVTEAPRGLLLHRYGFDDNGTVTAADVITPTALNAASIEERFRRVVERDPRAGDEALRPRLERVARAYDPCISCSVHVVRTAGRTALPSRR